MPNAPVEWPLRSWLWYVVEHETHHKAQLTLYLRRIGMAPPFLLMRCRRTCVPTSTPGKLLNPLIALGKTRFYVLKHTLGTLLGRQNASAFLIRQCLGHKSLCSSMQYVNVSDQDANAMAQEVFMDAF